MSKVRSIESPSMIAEAKRSVVCRICTRPVTWSYNGGNAAHRGIIGKCPVHGTLKKGEHFLTGYSAVFGGDGND